MKKYVEMDKTEYDNVLAQQFGQDVHLVDIGEGELRVAKFIGYEDGDAEYEMNDEYPKPVDEISACGGVKITGVDGVVFL